MAYPSILQLAKIVRGADTPIRSLTPYSEGLLHWQVVSVSFRKMVMIIWQNNSMYMMHFMHFVNQITKKNS